MQMGSRCACPHQIIVPGLVALIGVMFLMNALGYISDPDLRVWWPIVLIAIGLTKMFSAYCMCFASHQKLADTAIPPAVR